MASRMGLLRVARNLCCQIAGRSMGGPSWHRPRFFPIVPWFLLPFCCLILQGCAKEETPSGVPEYTAEEGASGGPWCGTNKIMEMQRLEARRGILRVEIRWAISACQTLNDPDASDLQKADARKTLANVLGDLERLQAEQEGGSGKPMRRG